MSFFKNRRDDTCAFVCDDCGVEHQLDGTDFFDALEERGGGWEKLINRTGPTWRNLPTARKLPQSDPEWTLLVREHPALVRRPVVVTADGVASVGFTDALFKKRFGV